MGSARATSAGLVSFLSEAGSRGANEALRTLHLEGLAGRPIEDVFLGLADYLCPDGGTIDEGIARDAFIETIADLAGEGIADLDDLSGDQISTVLELYATHAIELRICNDIGMKIVNFPADPRAAERAQAQLRDFIRRSVSDALVDAQEAPAGLTSSNVQGFVDEVYRSAFEILEVLGEEASK